MIEKYALFKIFQALKDNKEESVRSLAKKANVSIGTASTGLDYLYKKGIINKKVIGNVYQYRMNTDHFLTRHLKISYTLAEISESGLVDELIEYPVVSILLYGSCANGTDGDKSDIDILLITRKDFKIKPIKAKLEREVTIIKYSHNEWKKKADKDKAFYDSVITEGISLYGEIPVVK